MGRDKWPFQYFDGIFYNFHPIRFFLFLNNPSCHALQKGLVFVNVNNFHYFETCDTIDWYNFQTQMIRQCF